MKSALVAGGGIAGLLAARLLADRGWRVLLVEREGHCGGLLGSIRNANGISFDHGAHLLSETGMPALDEVLLAGLDPSRWHEFTTLRAGNWFGGVMNRDSPFPDARRLGAEDFARGMAELAVAPGRVAAPQHLGQVLEARFGPTFTTGVVAVALRKQLGVGPAELHPETPFALRRLICADAEESRRLKQDPRLEAVVAFTSYVEGGGVVRHRYPREGGIGQWVEHFVAGLRKDGVEVLTGRSVARVQHGDGQVHGASLDDGRCLDCDLLAWTLPSAMLLRAAGIPFEGQPPPARPIGLFHMVFDRPFADSNYHVTCYDEDLALFRATLYPNVRGAPDRAPYNCTAEVIGAPGTDFPALAERVAEELGRVGVLAAGARMLSCDVTTVPVGFPATTHGFMAAAAGQAELAKARLGNALLLGRARCPPFFTSDVLIDAYRAIEAVGHG